MSGAVDAVRLGGRRALYEVKTVVARYPAVAIPIARRRHGVPVGPDTEIVIEGFPRTGNTFAERAFVLAQDRPVQVACHVHAPAQLITAAHRGVPAIALARPPEETVLSFVIRHPHIPLGQALRGYARFYEPLAPHRERLVVAPFDEVTTDFGAVIRRVNERFGTAFKEFDHTPENVRACLDQIDRGYRTREERGDALERIVARPSEARQEIKERLRPRYRADDLRGLRARAESAFEALVGSRRDSGA
jgi:hypothetical protein